MNDKAETAASSQGKDNFLSAVFPVEIEEINRRRESLGQVPIDTTDVKPSSEHRLMGLCLSGGGIRSACFNLGVIQAAVEHGVFQKVDYLSTVSGGGYIGGCVSAVLNGGALSPNATTTTSEFPLHPDFKCEALKHLREHANYLAPTGWRDLLTILIRMFGGGLAHIIGFLPYPILVGWGLAVAMGSFGDTVHRSWTVNWSALKSIWFIFLGVLLLSAIINSKFRFSQKARNLWGRFFTILCLASLAISGLLALPACVSLLDRLITYKSSWSGNLWIIYFAAFVVFQTCRRLARTKPALLRRFALGFTAVLGPVLLLAIVIIVAWWAWFGVDVFSQEMAGHPPPGAPKPLIPRDPQQLAQEMNRIARESMLFLGAISVIFLYSIRLDVNASSMHTVYRDALSRTFLFIMRTKERITHVWKTENFSTLFGNRCVETPVDEMLLSELNTGRVPAPYHLINAAVNTPGSMDPTLKARRADFFLFSKRFVGAPSTGYCATVDFEQATDCADLGSVVAVSGAAVAPNMGTHSVWELSFLLSILDARLGLWIPNPQFLHSLNPPPTVSQPTQAGRFTNTLRWMKSLIPNVRRGRAPLIYLFREITGRFSEQSPLVNVSDGGHIENLGLFELLKRRCSTIFVADAEADPQIGFDGLSRVSEYALTDLQTRINIDYKVIKPHPESSLSGGHVVCGTIDYPEGPPGILIYLKSSLCGDELPFVRERRRKDAHFPHTPTSNQFFTQSDFEAYRELGHHVAADAFSRCST